MQTEFLTRLAAYRERSDLILLLNPQMVKMPLPMKRHDDPFFPFGKAIIAATQDIVCGYAFDLGAYLRLGAAGAIALERTISYVEDALTILHGPFSGGSFTEISDENAFGVDAVTLVMLEADYLRRTDRGALVMGYAAPERPGTGYYDPREGMMGIRMADNSVAALRVMGEAALYAGHGEDYAEQTRQALLELHGG